MKTSVLIPAYNCEPTIEATLQSVLNQAAPPTEILVMDDGSTDGTASLLRRYEPRITIFRQSNRGVANALNVLCKLATGEFLAILGSDDLWHPRYLELQRRLWEQHPDAVAFFTGHVNFSGYGDYLWHTDPLAVQPAVEVIAPHAFLRRYNSAPGPFACMSHCCFPKRSLGVLGREPFQLRMAEDLYFFNLLAPLGPIVYDSTPLVAYRLRSGSLSSDRLLLTEAEVNALELLEDHYLKMHDRKLRRIFSESFAMKRRQYAKVLLGVGRTTEARAQITRSLGSSAYPISFAKSFGLLLSAYLPSRFQPAWPSAHREPSAFTES